jgi:HD-GYP domain-containing protein (c-di-GMP phosphodiesterase class II)
MSAPERQLYEQHCLYGMEIGQHLELPQTTLDIIARHHEMMDGSGFPQGLNDPATMPLDARIVGMVNFFDNLVNPRTPSRAVTPHVALSYMFAKAKNKFDAAAISALIKTLGVYPPGSLVQLSDRRLGMVTAANPASPMRPIVMLYDEARPRHRAESLDLSKEPKITIIKAFNPASLPSTISAWLNPGRRISYFFDAGAAAAPS